jgi:hypothetical protein
LNYGGAGVDARHWLGLGVDGVLGGLRWLRWLFGCCW